MGRRKYKHINSSDPISSEIKGTEEKEERLK
jgi:hypothetical protein